LDTNPTDGVFSLAKHDESLKLEIVQAYLAGPIGYKALAKRYEVARSSLRRWIAGYQQHGAQALSKKFTHYSQEFKLRVLREIKQQGLSQAEAAARFDVRCVGAVSIWQRQYDEGGPEALKPKPRGRPPKTMPTPKPPKAQPPADDASALEKLRKENEYLRAEVAYLKKLEALVRARRQPAQNKRKPSSS
jgi:transposase